MTAALIEMVTDEDALAALWPEWMTLWRRVPDALPFLAPPWLTPWWQVFGNGQPVVGTLRIDGALAGVLPLYRLGNKLLPIGVGISDYFDALLAPEAPPGAAARLLAATLAVGSAPRCDLPELPPDALLLRAAIPDGWRREDWAGPPCPVLRLLPVPAIPRGIRRDLRLARNRAARIGGFVIERAGGETWPGLLRELIRLHGIRWQGRDESGVLADPDVLAFHRLATPALLKAGLLRLETLRLHGMATAVMHALLGKNTIFFYLSGFDPAFGFESPGTILLGHMIDTAIAEDRHEAHFLRGDEGYKYDWGAVDRRNSGRSFVRA